MDRKTHLDSPHLQSGASGDEEPSFPAAGLPINSKGQSASDNRGQRAPAEGSGVVTGSGAGAGGAGGGEDFDSDPAAGGGAAPRVEDDQPERGGNAPIGGSR